MSENNENKTAEVKPSGSNVSIASRPGEGTGYAKKAGDYRPRRDRGNSDGKGGFVKRNSFFRPKKECYFSKNHIGFIDYKNVDLLKRFLGKNGRILPRRITGTKLIHQRRLANAVKRARYMGLLPFVGSIWSQDYYEQQSREFAERKKQGQMRIEENTQEKINEPILKVENDPETAVKNEEVSVEKSNQ